MSGNLGGYVLRNQKPVSNVTVMIVEGPGSHADVAAETGSDGWFVFENLPAGRWVLRAHAHDGGNGMATADISDGIYSEVTIVLSEEGTAPQPDIWREQEGTAPQPDIWREQEGTAPQPDIWREQEGTAPQPDIWREQEGTAPQPDIWREQEGTAPQPDMVEYSSSEVMIVLKEIQYRPTEENLEYPEDTMGINDDSLYQESVQAARPPVRPLNGILGHTKDEHCRIALWETENSLPQTVKKDLIRLEKALADEIPPKTSKNLLVATWNLRTFGNLTAKWLTGPKDSPKRDWHAIACIAAIASHFDVIALQEVKRNPASVRCLLSHLGPQWQVIASDVTEGDAGNGERLAFLYDASRVKPSGLVGEIVLPSAAGKPSEQFARTPYAAGFIRGNTEFTMATVHVLWGDRASDRLPEISKFAQWVKAWAVRENDWNPNLLVLGDFNIDRIHDPLYQAFVSEGLWPPTELNKVPRSIFENEQLKHFYDQIAWFSTPHGESLLQSMAYTQRAGFFDFVPHAMTNLTRREISWRISDHYPIWVEFQH